MLSAQILAVIIFILMFLALVTDRIEHHIVTLGCALLVLIFVFGFAMHDTGAALKTLNIKSIFTPGFWYTSASSEESSGINWSTIIFLAGMMVMVEGMGKSGFFRWLCLTLAKAVKYKTLSLFVTFMIMSAVLAMFIDSITVIMFLAAVTVELAELLRFNPVPMIISEIFCANLGGSATMCGDPPNIIIGTSLGYSFSDFVLNTGLIALISLVFTIVYFYFCFKKELSAAGCDAAHFPSPNEAINNKGSFFVSLGIFLLAVVLLITHAQSGLTVAAIGIIAAALTLIAAGRGAISLLKKIDCKTLLFFIGLFVVVGGLEETGILVIIADLISKASCGSDVLLMAIIVVISGLASAFVDNIPFAATMVPIIQALSGSTGVDLKTLSWALSMGTDIGGSATPIGASANVVGTSISTKSGHPITWGTYCKYSAPAAVIVTAISIAAIYLRYF